jgi:polysaccharide biosynthesis/export protein
MTFLCRIRTSFVIFVGLSVAVGFSGQAAAQPVSKPQAANTTTNTPVPPAVPADYVIGAADVLSVVFWKEKDFSAEVMVRPDGKISLPMLNDVMAVGLTPEQLAASIEKVATKFVRDPGATVMVKEIRSRKVYGIGEVSRPGAFMIGDEMNVLQALAEAGGLLEHADKGDIVVVRNENGTEKRFKFNYNDVVRGKDTQQNIRLVPGDTILVR